MKFSCIIPAYNEGPRIAKVLETALACPELDEVIVVNDGSSDDTKKIIDTFDHPKLQKINLDRNGGKTRAIFAGIESSTGEYIVMIDSDLLYLQPKHITSLIIPVRDKEVDVTLSIRENSLRIYKFLGTDFVSGERVLPKMIFQDETYFSNGPGFGLEVKINKKIIENQFSVKNIYLPGVITPRKSLKYGWFYGTISDGKMILDILGVMSIYGIIRQIWYLSRFSQM